MADYREAFVGIVVAKLKNAIAIAESGRTGEIRYVGEVEASDASNAPHYPAYSRKV